MLTVKSLLWNAAQKWQEPVNSNLINRFLTYLEEQQWLPLVTDFFQSRHKAQNRFHKFLPFSVATTVKIQG